MESAAALAEAHRAFGFGDQHPMRLQKQVADMFLSLNDSITSGDLHRAAGLCTESITPRLLNSGAPFPSSGAGFAKASGVTRTPELLQARVIAMNKVVRFCQATFLVSSYQTPVEPRLHPYRRGIRQDDFSPPKSDEPWRPAAGPGGSLYWYKIAKPAPIVAWTIPIQERIRPVAYRRALGTLGETGKWLQPTVVQNFVTVERPIHRRDVLWRIHHW